ncbi:MAG: ASPIC/UnbV domain-containing protein [Ignavibacteriaceae bacterium]|nr:ASPIC/UnbV domain-containing protein [Ignavibacteriaceae bacterium]
MVKLKSVISGNSVWQMRKVAGQNGYCGQNLQVHFGLGDATQIDSLVIEWPSGIIQNVDGININDYNLVVEDTNTVSVEWGSDQPLDEFKLFQNYPNPFNPSTVISYQLTVSSKVILKVYDLIGNLVATLVDEEKQRRNL